MKKLLPFLLCAAILLAGCTNASESEASSSSETSSVSETVSSEETSDAASSEAQSESSEEAQTANLESAVAALEAVNPIENPLTYTDFDVENTLMLTLDNLVAYKGDVSNNQADCGLVFVAQAKEGKVADVEAELQAYKYVEFADKMALAKEARIVTNGNYVAMVIASVGVGDYTEIDQTLETALNF